VTDELSQIEFSFYRGIILLQKLQPFSELQPDALLATVEN